MLRVLFLVAWAALAVGLVRFAAGRDRVLGWIAAAALLLYVAGGVAFGAYLQEVRGRPYFSPDEIGYLNEGQRIIDAYRDGRRHQPILQGAYPYWNALVMSLWGRSLTPLRLSNALAGAATVVGAFFLARELFASSAAARAAALAAMLCPSLVVWSLGNLRERWLALFVVLATLAAARLIARWGWGRLAALALSLCGLGLLRHYYGAILGWLCAAGYIGLASGPPRLRVLRSAVVVATVGGALWVFSGSFMATGMRHEHLRRYEAGVSADSADFSLQGQRTGRAVDAGPKSLPELARGLLFVLVGRFQPRGQAGRVLSAVLFPEWLLMLAVLPLSAIGLFASVRRGSGGALVAAGFIGGMIALLTWVHGDEWTTHRFRIIYLPLLLVFAAGGVEHMIRRSYAATGRSVPARVDANVTSP